MSSDKTVQGVDFVLRRLAARGCVNLVETDGRAASRESDGIRFRVHDGRPGGGMRTADGFVPIGWIDRGGERLVEGVGLAFALAVAELGGGPPPAMAHRGTFRVHFNRHGAAPLVWCVATDEWELAIASVTVDGVELRTVYRPKATPDDEDGKPSAWLEVTGVLTIAGAEARITRSPR